MKLNGIITTPGRPSVAAVTRAEKLANNWGLPLKRRAKRSVARMINDYGTTVFVVTASRIEAFSTASQGKEPLFFHPNAAMFRAKNWLKCGEDPLVDACRLEKGDTVIDATLGLGADAQMAGLAVGPAGCVTGIEASPVIAAVVKEGLAHYEADFTPLVEAMKRITVVNASSLDWFRKQPSGSADVIYFDPMFEAEVKHSDGFNPLRAFADFAPLTEEIIAEARRVARKRVVLKDHFRSSRFRKFGFTVQLRPSATYHFGVIEMEESEAHD